MPSSLDTLRQDLAYAMRGLRAKPAFTLAVVATLALGIGANAAMFGIVDRLLFRTPPLLRDPATAHRVYYSSTYRGKEGTGGIGRYVRYQDLRRWTTSFSQLAGWTWRPLAVGEGENAREMNVGVVSASFFGFFDAPPVIGRYFSAAEDTTPDGTAVAVLSYAMWQAQYGGRTDAIGSTMRIGPVLYTIVGVAPKGFVGLFADRPPIAYIPITKYGSVQNCAGRTRPWFDTYSCGWMNVIARRKPGVTLDQANADLTQALVKSYQAQIEEQPTSTPIQLARPHGVAGSILAERGPNRSSTSRVAAWVGGVSIIVLLIACANVANLLLARALTRRREVAVRIALGVSRMRLLRQLLTESVVLAALGGVVGLFVAHWGGAVLRATLLDQSEAPAGLRDGRTVLFALAAALAVGLLTGLAPVLQARKVDLVQDLKLGVREGHGRSRLGGALLVMQATLSVVLLIGAGLFVRSLNNVHGIRLGYDVDPVLVVSTNMRGEKLDSAQQVNLLNRLQAAAKAAPGVENASRQTGVPFWSNSSMSLFVEGIDTVSRLGQFDYNVVSPEFFRTLGTRIIRGRGIAETDTRDAPRVAVVSENMGRVLWPGRDPIGQCMRVGADTMPCTTVVGIAENIRETGLVSDSGYYYYMPNTQFRPLAGGLFVRVRGNAAQYREPLRRALQREMLGASYVNVTPFADIVGPNMRSWQLGATMFVAFGALALLLAAVGLYSVIAYNVAQRTHELGVRLALGAQPSDLATHVLGDGARVAAVGLAIGVAIALWASRWLEPLLFGVSPKDVGVYVTASLALLLVALAGSWIPARRAARTDPNIALRTD